MKQKKAFIKPFEAPQRSMKIKIQVDSLSLPGIGTGRVNTPSTTSGYLVFLSVSFNMKKIRNLRLRLLNLKKKSKIIMTGIRLDDKRYMDFQETNCLWKGQRKN